MEFCNKGLVKPKLPGLAFFTAIIILALASCIQYDSPPDPPPPDPPAPPRERNLQVRFGASSASAAFTALHNRIQAGGNWASEIALGDYIDLPSLTIGGTTITDAAISANSSRLLRLIVVGKNSFKRDIPGAGSVSANQIAPIPDHVVFQFQNVPITYKMNSSDTNAGGYAASAMRTYINGAFLTGLQAATGLTSTELWAPRRKVANGGSGATAADMITDMLWLPTEWEMRGYRSFASQTNEVDAGQARLEYYDPWNRTKRDSGHRNGIPYWVASPSSFTDSWVTGTRSFCMVDVAGTETTSTASDLSGCVPAFCVK
ncbi:hypothetical protein FACS1894147_09910 [Spirochaetia bacterium]|nr:hypothetical protein FACS1894147_09910 [Spirochaetia bacterium]